MTFASLAARQCKQSRQMFYAVALRFYHSTCEAVACPAFSTGKDFCGQWRLFWKTPKCIPKLPR